MALATYTDLQTSIGNWLKRDDLAAQIPDFITLAEARFNRKLRLRAMETSVTTTVSGQTYSMPADIRKIERFFVTTGGREYDLLYKAPGDMAKFSGQTGMPLYFTTINQQAYLYPAPDAAYDITMFYMTRVPALSVSNTTNWLLTNAPDVYLYGSLLQAAPYMKDDQRIAIWEGLYRDAVESTQASDDEQQIPDSSLQIKADVKI
ncbi:MAG: hypothetical protein E6Q97_29285 [Desulfurellales bacterium]|nr:MAG: hypothetical protein E6Q97_29285 [Desulfurellales bacterium]